MAIVFDTSVNGGDSIASWSHTVTGANPALFVVVSDRNQAISGVTYNSVSLTLLTSLADANQKVYIFGLLNPATGSHTVTITGGGSAFAGMSASYTGVGSITDSSNTGSSGSSPLTVATTVIAANCWLLGVAASAGASTTNLSSNRTDRQSQGFFTGFDEVILSDSNGTIGTGSQSITWSSSVTVGLIGALISFSPVPVIPNIGSMLLMFK